jgi:hypothetical protein
VAWVGAGAWVGAAGAGVDPQAAPTSATIRSTGTQAKSLSLVRERSWFINLSL